MKKKMPLKIVIFISLFAIIIAIGAGSFALAYWSGSPEQVIAGEDAVQVDNSENATTKYLIFAPIDDLSDDYCFEYSDANGWVLKFEYGADYVINGGANQAGSRASAEASISSADKTAIKSTGIKVIGYIGTLGQFENLVIPNSISWDSSTITVSKIEIKMTEYKESMDLITGVVIPSGFNSSNGEIAGASFSGAGNLVNVYFDSETLPTISTYAFRGMNSGIHYYKKSGDNYVAATIR